jgi:hypothetical protein
MEVKDPSMKHFYISLVKSGVRIAAGAALMNGMIWWAGILLVAAEFLGIAEEL